jgi:hypothetical protein
MGESGSHEISFKKKSRSKKKKPKMEEIKEHHEDDDNDNNKNNNNDDDDPLGMSYPQAEEESKREIAMNDSSYLDMHELSRCES